ncbi:MFS transporter [Tundrisphaera lichenicola]|uniref:MFS transporter n=1 Tax=Tundrisphaera lichenicola TaxID=2029860 RepID=UPI003EC11E60
MNVEECHPSRASLRALDLLNLVLADVRDGLGPYLAIYLATKHWDPSRIGMAMSAMGIASVIAQTPAGALIDRTTRKRSWMVVAAILVALGSVAMVRLPTLPVILGAQAIIGAASAIFAPAIAAVSLGLVGHSKMSRRTGRNEAFNHAGNVVAAILAGLIGDHIAYEGIFYLLAGMCGASIIATLMIRPDEIDDDLARGGEDSVDGVPKVAALGALFRDRRILVFSASVVLFHFANAAMLPLVGQKLTTGKTDGVAGYMSACIIAAQLVMVPVAILASRMADSWGRRSTFLIGFAVLPVRGFLYTMTGNPYALVAIQLLDGIGAGIFGVVGILVIADLTRGSGRFNVMQGALATATGIGSSASNLMTGAIVSRFGFNVGFLVLSAIAGVALAFFALAMPETRDPGGFPVDETEPHPQVDQADSPARVGSAP